VSATRAGHTTPKKSLPDVSTLTNVTRVLDLMASAAPTRFAPTPTGVSLAPARLATPETHTSIAMTLTSVLIEVRVGVKQRAKTCQEPTNAAALTVHPIVLPLGLVAAQWLAPTTSSAPATPSASTAPVTARNPTLDPTVKIPVTLPLASQMLSASSRCQAHNTFFLRHRRRVKIS